MVASSEAINLCFRGLGKVEGNAGKVGEILGTLQRLKLYWWAWTEAQNRPFCSFYVVQIHLPVGLVKMEPVFLISNDYLLE